MSKAHCETLFKKVVVTRPDGESFAEKLRSHGFNPILITPFRIAPINHTDSKRKDTYDWAILTSKYGAKFGSQLMEQEGYPANIAAIGEQTSLYYREYTGRAPSFTGTGHSSERFAAELLSVISKGQSAVHLTSTKQRGVLAPLLETGGIKVSVREIYAHIEGTIPESSLKMIHEENPDNIIYTFFSPSSLYSLLTLIPDFKQLLSQSAVVVIGETTRKAFSDLSIEAKAIIKAQEPSEEGMLQALLSS